MSRAEFDADAACRDVYEAAESGDTFEETATAVLAVGKDHLGVENGHLTRIDPASDFWKNIASTDPPSGRYPPGDVLSLGLSYCRRTIESDGPLALHDAKAQGWADDPAYEVHGLDCYHGSTVHVDGELYGTVCFVSADARDRPFSPAETVFAELVARTIESELQSHRADIRLERLDGFADAVSHDLRNPLNVAQGRLDLARERLDGDPDLAIVARSLNRMQELIEDALTIARQGHDVTESELETLSLEPLARSCWDHVDTKDATLSIGGDLVFRADPKRVRLLFENLLRNAIEHGGNDVSIRIGRLDDGTGFYVEDDGPGIPEAHRDSIFETGFSTGHGGGLGLGLAIVDGVADAHDWTISVTEGSEGGARFEVNGLIVAPEESPDGAHA